MMKVLLYKVTVSKKRRNYNCVSSILPSDIHARIPGYKERSGGYHPHLMLTLALLRTGSSDSMLLVKRRRKCLSAMMYAISSK
jgi:hypothetical protein